MRALPARVLPLACAAILSAQAADPILPLRDLHAGMRGTGRTVFSGTKIENFDVEILGILQNIGPKQSLILGRLSGGPLEKTGVMQGMSGSPVYIDGKLIGAVAMAFQYSKEPIAGIRPIEEMLAAGPVSRPQIRAQLTDKSLTERLPAQPQPQDRPADIATPLSLTGFTRGTVEQFAPSLRALGLEPRQGVSGGRAPNPPPPAPPEPGSMISVQLVTGDLSVGADGTVTRVDGNRIYAFGHRFLAIGETEMPFSNASVVAVLPNLNTSFKISAAGSPLGTLTTDYNAGVAGVLGRSPKMADVRIAVTGAARNSEYKMQMVQDQVLSPMLLQMMIYSAIDGSERTTGPSTLRLSGSVRFEGAKDPVKIETMYSGDYNVPLVASLGAALPVAYALQNSVDPLQVAALDLTVEALPGKRHLSIEQVWSTKKTVRPGETLDVNVLLEGEGGREVVRRVQYQVPVGAPAGPLNISVADGPSTNAGEGRAYTAMDPRPAHQVVKLLNSLRGSTKGYVRFWRSDPGYLVEGRDLPDPPPSAALILGRSYGAATAAAYGSTLAEVAFDAGEAVVSGAKTIQVEVKE